jgi:hypothetical protein
MAPRPRSTVRRPAPQQASGACLSGPGWGPQVRSELARWLLAPRAELSILVGNAALVCAGWFLLPLAWRGALFGTVPGSVAFALALETWLLSDVTSTNLLGHDPDAAARAVRAGSIRRLLQVKATAVALVIGVPCAVIAVLSALAAGTTGGVAIAVLILTLPFGVTALASILGVLWPYRGRSLTWRWTHRRPWAATARWVALTTGPFLLIAPVTTVLIVPGFILARAAAGAPRTGSAPPTTVLILAAAFGSLLSLTVFAVAPRVADRIARSSPSRLLRELAD